MPSRRTKRPLAVIALAGLLSAALTACGTGGGSGSPSPSTLASPTPEPSSAGPSVTPSAEPTQLTVGLGFDPNVQFAPFYLADQAGYYADEGLEVTFQNKIDPELVTLVGAGAIDLGLADGTSVIPAASQGIPVRYVATIYGRFPSIVFAKASSGIDSPEDLAGKTIGIPGRFGSSWIMLQALLASAGLGPNDVNVSEIGFTQREAVQQGSVDAATGFVNNEPVQLELAGEPVSVLRVDDATPLPGNGIIVSQATLDAKREAVAGFVRATLRAMEEIEANPTVGVDAAVAAVPALAQGQDTQRRILDATIATWSGPYQEANGLGAIDPEAWATSIEYMSSLGMVTNPVSADDLIVTDLLAPG